jgi:hypothetical protein
MSLINDALKKAQKKQTEQPAPTASASPFAGRPTRLPGPVMSFERMLLVVVTLVAVIVGVTAVAVLLTRKDDRSVAANLPRASAPESTVATTAALEPPVAPVSSPAATSAPIKTTTDLPATVPPSRPTTSIPVITAETAPEPARAVPRARPPPATPAPPPVSPPPAVAPAVSVDLGAIRASVPAAVAPNAPPVASAAHSIPVPPPPAVPAKNPKILTFLEHARVGGVRLAGDDSKVVLNDHVYRVNNTVSLELGLRLTAVSATTLAFVDENGLVYTKTY